MSLISVWKSARCRNGIKSAFLRTILQFRKPARAARRRLITARSAKASRAACPSGVEGGPPARACAQQRVRTSEPEKL